MDHYQGQDGTNYRFFDPNVQEKREDFWMHKLQTLYPEELNMKRINQ